MRVSSNQTRLGVLFVMTQVGAWTGCNAILGNGYGVDDLGATDSDGAPSADGSPTEDGPLADGMSADGTTTIDGASDGPFLDTSVDGGPCPNGVCPTKLTAATGPQQLAVSSAAVYWTNTTGINVVSVGGGTPTFLALGGFAAAPLTRGVAVGPTGIPYVTLPGGGKAAAECALDLFQCNTTFIGSAASVSSITTGAANVYVGIFDDGSGSAGGIDQTSLSGTSLVVFTPFNDQVLDLQAVGANVYFRTPTSIRYSSGGASAAAASLGADAPQAFVVHNGSIVIAASNNHILRCALSGNACTGPVAVAHSTTSLPTAITADDTYIYWLESAAGTVHRCDFPACVTTTLLATGQVTPTAIAMDATSIYWTNYGSGGSGMGGSIMKLPK